MGSIAYFGGQNSAPDGWILCDGAAISRETYATLFSAIGTTYGTGDGSTTFALPNLIDKFVEGSATAGTVKGAGLPNITGRFTVRPTYYNNNASSVIDNENGAFYRDGRGGLSYSVTGSTSSFDNYEHKFDASRSSNIYGNSTTVQPPALTMKPFIYTGKTTMNKWQRTA